MPSRRFMIPALALIFILFPSGGTVQAAPVPQVTLDLPASAPLGDVVTFEVTFDNAGDTGYGPYLDLWLPTRGADGSDGLYFQSASYKGSPIDAEPERTFPAGGCVDHPYLQDVNSNPIPICGTPGDTLVVLPLPFGSFTPNQPPVTVEIQARLSRNADFGVPLSVQVRGGFRFGENALDDPCCDPYVVTDPVTGTLMPAMLTLTKTNNLPENEAATGPNNPFEWTLSADIPDGQTISDLVLTDTLPDGIVFEALVSVNPPLLSPLEQTGQALTLRFGDVTGTNAPVDLTAVLRVHAAQTALGGGAVIDPQTGDDETAFNNADLTGLWFPNDPGDGSDGITLTGEVECPSAECPGGAAPVLMAAAVQKSVLVAGGADIQPGARLTYTLDFQISDFFAAQDVVITDIFSDGQLLDTTPGFAPTFQFTQHGTPTRFDPITAYDVTRYSGIPAVPPAIPGDTRLDFRLSDQLGGAGRMLGGCVPAGGVATLDSDYCAAFDGGQTTGRIVYHTIIQDSFTDTFPSGDPSVDQGDRLSNAADLRLQLLNPQTFSPAGYDTETDDTEAEITIPRGDPSKRVYAVNGTPCGACDTISIAPGDTVTYLIQYDMPNTDFEDFEIIDFLPLPVYSAEEFEDASVIRDQINATVPAAGEVKLFQGDTLYNRMDALQPGTPAPLLSINTQDNTLTLDYGTFDDPANTPTFISVAFTVTVQDEPFADRLRLTNLVRIEDSSTNNDDSQDETIVQIRIQRPALAFSKGMVATSNPGGVFDPVQPSPIGFNGPGSQPSFDGLINSDGLDQFPIDSDLYQAKVGDIITFALVIDNRGSKGVPSSDIVLRDTPAPGYSVPRTPSGLNLQVRRGTGQAIGYESLPGGTGTAADLFGVGITLTNATLPVCDPYNGQDGTNIIVVTYDLELAQITADPMVNTSTMTYTGGGGGDDSSTYTGGGGGSGDGGGGQLTKSVDVPVAGPGTRLTWTLSVRNSSGLPMPDVRVVDTLPPNLDPVRASTTQGTVTLSGRTYTALLGELPPGAQATITLVTDIVENPEPPYILVNNAIMTSGGLEVGRADSSVTITSSLAQTGESPWRGPRRVLLALLGALSGAGLTLMAKYWVNAAIQR